MGGHNRIVPKILTYSKFLDLDDLPEVFQTDIAEQLKKSLLPPEPFEPKAMKRFCPKCEKTSKTKIKSDPSLASYLFCFLISITGYVPIDEMHLRLLAVSYSLRAAERAMRPKSPQCQFAARLFFNSMV